MTTPILQLQNILTRRTLIEKVSKNNELYIYTFPNLSRKIKNLNKGIETQIKEGCATAKLYNLKPREYSECPWELGKEVIISKVLLHLIKLVLMGNVKHIYARNLNMFCQRKRILHNYIIQIFVLKGVTLYNKKGIVIIDYLDCSNLKGFEDLDYFISSIFSEIKEPYAGLKIENT